MQATTVRPETPERWERALARALAAGIDALEVGGSDSWAVESGSVAGLVYLVDAAGRTCGCPAQMVGDPICKHRALVRFLSGDLALPTVACPGCFGEGWQAPGWGGWDGTPTRCDDCGGAGRVEATLAQVAAGAACGACRGRGRGERDEHVDGAVFAVATACGCDAGVAWEAERVARAEAEADRRLVA